MSEAVKAYGRGQVIEIINSVITKIDGSSSKDVYLHIAELAQIIDSLKKEISASRPEHVKSAHIPDATDELDAVVGETAAATNAIMGVCEEIEQFAAGLNGEKRDELTEKITRIYEACTFQDITGQRIRNVVGTLRIIEEKVDRIMSTLGDKVGLKAGTEPYQKPVVVKDDKSLMNGPQLASKAITQDDIDKLLADFDK